MPHKWTERHHAKAWIINTAQDNPLSYKSQYLRKIPRRNFTKSLVASDRDQSESSSYLLNSNLKQRYMLVAHSETSVIYKATWHHILVIFMSYYLILHTLEAG
jgi:hypothetical protein